MATPKQFSENETAAIDPFAVDFFGVGSPLADDDEPHFENQTRARKRAKPQKKADWHKTLPRVSNAEAEFSNRLGKLPENLTDESARIVAETLSRFTFQPSENAECSVVSVTETNLNAAVNSEKNARRVFLNVSCQPENAPAVVALDTDYAKSLIDLILGGKVESVANLRDLSPIETTIIEFLAANILGEINKFTGEPLLCLRSVKQTADEAFEPFERGAEIVLELEAGNIKGIVSLLASRRFLNQLDKTENIILVKKNGAKLLSDYEKIARKLDFRLQIGTTLLDGDSLLFLERDDIVLIEQPQIDLLNKNFGSSATVFVGRGGNFRLRGMIVAGDDLNFKISDIMSEEARRRFAPAKFTMDELENESADETSLTAGDENADEADEMTDEQITPSLENVQVALRVEIAGDKISLRELQNLRAGQIIALGVSPNDTVRLVTDSSEEPVAAGELVEIEGQLGVRLTKVFI